MQISTGITLIIVNISGALYTALTIVSIAILNLYCTCPALYGDCFWPTVYSAIILSEIFVNLLLFHYYNKRNQVQFWTAKSSSLLGTCNFEQQAEVALNGQFVNDKKSRTNSSTKNSQPAVSKTKHEIKSYTKYAICENGTYVDLRSELWGPDYLPNATTQAENNNNPTKYCHECKKITPRRCHHCPLCKICVLRKDHHCFLLGGCAGLANQRYFIVFLFWATIGAAYGTSFNFAYLNQHIATWYPFGWLNYLGPVAMIRWFLGAETLFNMFLALMFSISFASTLGALGFFTFQMLYTLSGYTMYDYHRAGPRRTESDGDSYTERLALVFGRRWYLNFLFPQFWNPNQMNERIARNIFLSVSKDL